MGFNDNSTECYLSTLFFGTQDEVTSNDNIGVTAAHASLTLHSATLWSVYVAIINLLSEFVYKKIHMSTFIADYIDHTEKYTDKFKKLQCTICT